MMLILCVILAKTGIQKFTKSWMPILIGMTVLMFATFAHAGEKESAYDRVIRTGVLKVGYFVWPPYQIQDPNNGKIIGISAEYVDLLSKFLDLKIEWVQVAGLGTQVEGLKRGMYDVVVNDSSYVFTMIKYVDFSDPVFYAPVFAYGRSDDKRFHKLPELNSEKVGFVGMDGDLSVDLVQRFYPKAKLETLPANSDPGMMMTNVVTNKADIIIIDPPSVNTFNKTHKAGLSIISPDTPIAVYPVGFSLMKDDGKLLTLINGAVAAMHNTNSINPILKNGCPKKVLIIPLQKIMKYRNEKVFEEDSRHIGNDSFVYMTFQVPLRNPVIHRFFELMADNFG